MADFEEVRVALCDGYQAYARYWPALRAQGAVLYLHGIQSHCGWYEQSARRLRECGFHVLQIDRRGSGRNFTSRGHADSADQLIKDALTARDELLRRSGATGYHMIGVSWGGRLAVASYVTDPTGVLSLTLVTPGLFPIINVSIEEKARIGFAMLYDRHKLFDIPLNDAELFTDVPRWQTFFRNDELTLRQASAAFYLASRRMDRIIDRLPKSSSVPIHLLLASQERIIHNDRTRAFIRTLHWPDVRITTYDHARHSLEFLSDPEPYFTDLIEYLAQLRPQCC